MLKAGDRLNNGAVVLAAREEEGGSAAVVLALSSTKGPVPFVTWHVRMKDGACFWGSYHTDLEAALEDYKSRAGGRNATPAARPVSYDAPPTAQLGGTAQG